MTFVARVRRRDPRRGLREPAWAWVGLRALAFAAGISAPRSLPRRRPEPARSPLKPAAFLLLRRPSYLLGEVEMSDGRGPAMMGRLDSVDSYNPASYRGGVLRLHYARAAELGPWLDLVAVRGEVVVQFWLKPGETAVTLEKGEEREVERIPAQLRRFL